MTDITSLVSSDLYLFYRLVTASRFKENLPAGYIKEISRELMKLKRGDYKRLCVSLPPRHSKSSLITISYPLFLFFNNRSLNILIVTNSQVLSEKFGIALREYVSEFGEAFDVFLSDVKHSNSHLMFTNSEGELYTGSIRLVGAGGSITGQDADYIILDDPYKGFEDITPTLLQKKIDWFNTIVLQRLEPESRLLLLHTRWHSNDLIGFLKDNSSKDYKFISFPAINPDGSVLWPERYTRDILEDRKVEMGERLFEAIYQQNPLDDSSDFFNIDKIRFNEKIDQEVICSVRAWDIASEENPDSDYTVGAKVNLLNDHKTIVLDNIVRGKFSSGNLNVIRNTAESDGVNTHILIEPGVGASANLLFDEWSRQLQGYQVEQMKPVTSKQDRATPLQNSILDNNFVINLKDDSIRGDVIKELKSFPMGVHDDIVDSIAYGVNFLLEKYKDFEPVSEFIDVW